MARHSVFFATRRPSVFPPLLRPSVQPLLCYSFSPPQPGMPPKPAAPPPGGVDFRCSEDDAWYSVRLRLEAGGCAERRGRPPGEESYLRVMYCDFLEVWDERFWAGSFEDESALEEFSRRFRAPSVQLQDGECRGVAKGMVVCASYAFGENDIRFYDALVEEVCFLDHKIIKGAELCTCSFVLLWQHGPNAGRKITTGIEHICLLQQRVTQINPALDLFLELSRKSINSGRQSVCCGEFHHATVRSEPNESNGSLPDTKSSKWFDNTRETFTGRSSTPRQSLGQDTDLGGTSSNKAIHPNICFYFILIENLEKDLLPHTIVDFIYQRTSILSQVYISPSLVSESYARGTIFLEMKEKADKLLSFLQNPDQIVVSFRGRPWVITEPKLNNGTAGLIFKSEKQLSNKLEENYELRVVRAGTADYAKAKKLQELFTEFHDHLQRLHRRLVLEEMNLLQVTHAT